MPHCRKLAKLVMIASLALMAESSHSQPPPQAPDRSPPPQQGIDRTGQPGDPNQPQPRRERSRRPTDRSPGDNQPPPDQTGQNQDRPAPQADRCLDAGQNRNKAKRQQARRHRFDDRQWSDQQPRMDQRDRRDRRDWAPQGPPPRRDQRRPPQNRNAPPQSDDQARSMMPPPMRGLDGPPRGPRDGQRDFGSPRFDDQGGPGSGPRGFAPLMNQQPRGPRFGPPPMDDRPGPDRRPGPRPNRDGVQDQLRRPMPGMRRPPQQGEAQSPASRRRQPPQQPQGGSGHGMMPGPQGPSASGGPFSKPPFDDPAPGRRSRPARGAGMGDDQPPPPGENGAEPSMSDPDLRE